MPRTISGGLATFLNSGAPVDAVIIADVYWSGTNLIHYIDRTLSGDTAGYLPFIVEVSELDSQQNSDSSGTTNAITLTLSDLDGSLKAIIDTNDIHKNPVTVRQYFVGSDIADAIILFDGVINTPIIWDEGKRTLTFDVMTNTEDFEVGFSLEMVAPQNLPYKLIGKPFPMVFGTVMHVPALQLQEIPSAFTTLPFSIPDYNLHLEINKIIAQIAGLLVNFAKICSGISWYDDNCNQEDANAAALAQGAQNQAQVDQLTLQERALQAQLTFQQAFSTDTVPIIATMQVTQPYSGVFRVGNQLFNGVLKALNPVTNLNGHIDTSTPLLQPGNYDITKQLVKAGYIFNNAGTQVQICGPYPLVYVVSIVPGTVTAVYAFHSFKGLRTLVKVPSSYYTTQTNNYGVPCYCVTLKQPLSTTAFLYNLALQNWETNFGQYLPAHLINTIDWEDSLYVSFTSDIGPNPVDIMIYLITTYSQNGYDSASFSAVHSSVASLPMNFVLQSLDNLQSLLTEIAYQARCAIYLQDSTYFLVDLTQAGDPVDSISESDVNVGTLQVTTTSTEELTTVYDATFRPDYSPVFQDPVHAIFRFNVKKYGYHTQTHDFFAYNSFAVVEKVATFWMIQKSMTWKILKCQLYLQKLNLTVFDSVTLNFTRTYISTAPVVGRIMSAKYNPSDKLYDVEIWTPVRLGEMVPYSNAWNYGQTEFDFFPTYQDIQSGSAGGEGGGEPRPLPPSNGIQLNIELNNRTNYTRGDQSPLSDDYPNDDGEPDIPTGAPGTYFPLPDSDAPGSLVYQYPDGTPPPVPAPELSRAYPGKIVGYLQPISTSQGPGQAYTVTIYRKGVLGSDGASPGDNGVTTDAIQLQIDPNDRIPSGSTVMIFENQYDSGSKNTDGSIVYKTERIIQVPIFLR